MKIRSKYKTNLKYLLRENKMTQGQLADIIGVDKRYLFSSKVKVDDMEKIAQLFMVTAYDLNYGSVKKSLKILRDVPAEIKKDKQTMESVQQFFKIIHNYKKLNEIFLDSIVFEPEPFNFNS